MLRFNQQWFASPTYHLASCSVQFCTSHQQPALTGCLLCIHAYVPKDDSVNLPAASRVWLGGATSSSTGPPGSSQAPSGSTSSVSYSQLLVGMHECPCQGCSHHKTWAPQHHVVVYNPRHGHRDLWVDWNLRGKPGYWTPMSKIGTRADHTCPSPHVILGDNETSWAAECTSLSEWHMSVVQPSLTKGTDFSWGTRRAVAAAVPATRVAAQVFLQLFFPLRLEAEEEIAFH